jgi:hypothetical protein
MSIVDKVIAAVTPPHSDEARREARARARAAAQPGGWLSMVLDHHEQLESAVEAVRQANDPSSRRAAQLRMATLATGHSLAEETALYPALATHHEMAHSVKAYTEQSATKIQLGALEDLDPMSQDYLDKLEHIRGALQQHMYEEEHNWFLDLQNKLDSAKQQHVTARFKEEFERYMSGGQAGAGSMVGATRVAGPGGLAGAASGAGSIPL